MVATLSIKMKLIELQKQNIKIMFTNKIHYRVFTQTNANRVATYR